MDNCRHFIRIVGVGISHLLYALRIHPHFISAGPRSRGSWYYPRPPAGCLKSHNSKMQNLDPKLPPPDPDPREPGPAPVPIREPENPDPDVIDPRPEPLPA